MQGGVGSQPIENHRRRFRRIERLRNGNQKLLRNADIFTIAARLEQNCCHGLLNLDGSNAAAEFIHNANDIIARHSGRFVILPKILTAPRHYLRLANNCW